MALIPTTTALVFGSPLQETARQPQTADFSVPANIQAEQLLLGALLYDNEAFSRVGDSIEARHFYEPFHARLFTAIEEEIRAGRLVEPILMAERFASDLAFSSFGGIRYLADLVDHAPATPAVPEYVAAIQDAALRRDLIRIGNELAAGASSSNSASTALDLLERLQEQAANLTDRSTSSGGFVSFSDALQQALSFTANAFATDGISGIQTGISDLDRKIGGLQPNDLLIFPTEAGSGRIGSPTNVSFEVSRSFAWEPQSDGTKRKVAGGRVALFSLEMSTEEVGLLLLAATSGVSVTRLTKGEIDVSDFSRVRDAALDLQEIPLYIDATRGISTPKLASRVRRLKRSVGLELIVIDELQGVRPGKANPSVPDLVVVADELASIARELSVPIMVGTKFIVEAKAALQSEYAKKRLPPSQGVIVKSADDIILFRGLPVESTFLDQDDAFRVRFGEQRISISDIQEAVASQFGLTTSLLLSPRKDQTVSKARHLAIWLSRKLTSQSLGEIAKSFEREHMTILNSIRRMDELMATNEDLVTIAERLTRRLSSV